MLKLKKLSVQASDEEDEPGTPFQEWALQWNRHHPLTCTLIVQRSIPQSSPAAKGTRRIRFAFSLHSQTVRACCHHFNMFSGVLQGGNIFAALSQGQSDEDEEDTPAKKVQCFLWLKSATNKCVLLLKLTTGAAVKALTFLFWMSRKPQRPSKE